ncbi:hypothetical protein [Clostridium hydrogeniformans]|uniref:hypothetical protein n=1 Tax=Clostridium hydrogeniformans TaxID=349933 RepID=UPI000485A438|nr:hypothetical protein [Clostridium hydrogeniformans]
MLFKTLKLIGEKLNEENIIWALGASMMLNHYNLVENPNDIDIIVDLKDAEKADSILRSLGDKIERPRIKEYSTKYFYEYMVHGIDIDLMSGFIINYDKVSYEYKFNKSSIRDFKVIDNCKIPLTSLEDWYILYSLMDNREKKVAIVENGLLRYGIKNKDIFEKALTSSIPLEIKNNIIKLLS